MSERPEISATRQRFIRIGTRRTSIRLEDSLWQALQDIAAAEGIDVHTLCTRLHASRGPGTYTSTLRIFIVDWMRHHAAGTDAAMPHPPEG